MKLTRRQLNLMMRDRKFGRLLRQGRRKSHGLTLLVLALLIYLVFTKANIFILLALLLLLIMLMRG